MRNLMPLPGERLQADCYGWRIEDVMVLAQSRTPCQIVSP